MPSPFLYFAGARLSGAELSAACLDGHLVALGEGYLPADVVESTFLRAASLAELLGDTLAATHESAAWVLGVIDDPPPRHTVQRAVPRRLHQVVSRRLIYRDPLVPSEDLLSIAGARVTTRPRTLADLARSSDQADRARATAWAGAEPDDRAGAIDWLDTRTAVPHKRAARMLLARAHDEVTRYTS